MKKSSFQKAAKRAKNFIATEPPLLLVGLLVGWFVVFCGGLNVAFRASSDAYAPLTANAFYWAVMVIVWVPALVFFVFLTQRLRKLKWLTNKDAAAFIITLLVFVAFALFTYRESSVVPRNHGLDERASIAAMVSAIARTLPKDINDDITENAVLYSDAILSFNYTIKNVAEHGWTMDLLKPQLMAQACEYFKNDSKYNSILGIRFAFSSDEKTLSLRVTMKDCLSVLGLQPDSTIKYYGPPQWLSPDDFRK